MKLISAVLFLILIWVVETKREEKEPKNKEKNKEDNFVYASKDLNVAGCLVNLHGNYYDLNPLTLSQTE